MTKLKEYVIALIRTSIVPPMAAYIITRFPVFEHTSVEMVLVVVLSGIWYSIFHGIEVLSQNPKIKKYAGIFLGFPAQPKYIKET